MHKSAIPRHKSSDASALLGFPVGSHRQGCIKWAVDRQELCDVRRSKLTTRHIKTTVGSSNNRLSRGRSSWDLHSVYHSDNNTRQKSEISALWSGFQQPWAIAVSWGITWKNERKLNIVSAKRR